MGDGHGLLSQTWLFRESLREGEWPGWTFYWYGGWSFTRAYGPLFPAIPGTLDLFLENPKRSVVLVVLGYRLLGLLTSYLCARGLGLGLRGALFAALFYTFCGQHSQCILRYGEFNLSLFYALLPLPVYFLAQAFRYKAWLPSTVLLASIAQSALILNHAELGAYALFGTVVACLLFQRFELSPQPAGSMGKMVIFLSATLLLSLFFLVQFGWTREFTLLGRETFSFRSIPNPAPLIELFQSDYSESHSWTIQYLGFPSAALLLMGATVAFKTRAAWGLANLCLLALIVCILLFSTRFRLLHLAVLPASLLIGMGADFLLTSLNRLHPVMGTPTGSRIIGFLLAALLVFDQSRLLPHGHYPYHPGAGGLHTDSASEAFGRKAREVGVFGRTLAVRSSLEATVWSDMEPLVTGYPTLAGGNIETAPPSWPYAAAFIDSLVGWVHHGAEPLFDLRDFAHLFGLRFVAFPQDAANPVEWGPVVVEDAATRCIEVEDYSPIIASRSWTPWQGVGSLDRIPGSQTWRSGAPDPSSFPWIANRMGLDRERLVCRTLLFRSMPSPALEADPANQDDLEFRFLSEEVRPNRVTLEFECSEPCYLRTAYPYDPRLEFRLDGETIKATPTAMHFSGLVCPTAGSHHLEIRAVFLPAEILALRISLTVWIAAIGVLVLKLATRGSRMWVTE